MEDSSRPDMSHVAIEKGGIQCHFPPRSRQRRLTPEHVARNVLHRYARVREDDHASARLGVVRDRGGATGTGTIVHYDFLSVPPDDVPAQRLFSAREDGRLSAASTTRRQGHPQYRSPMPAQHGQHRRPHGPSCRHHRLDRRREW